MIALKTNQESQNQKEEVNLDDQQQEFDDEESIDQIILLTQKLQRMIQRRDQQKRNFPTRIEKSKMTKVKLFVMGATNMDITNLNVH